MYESVQFITEDLVLEPLEGIVIESLNIKRTINEHGAMFITGKISDDKKKFLYDYKLSNTLLKLFLKTDDITLFEGIIYKVEIQVNVEESNTFSLECLTSSALLDIKNKSGTFQDIEEMYSSIVSKLFGKYEHNGVDFRVDDRKIGEVLIQYDETDWKFIKKIASKFEVGLYPLYISNNKISIGVPNINKNVVIEEISVIMKHLLKEGVLECDIQTCDILELGEKVIFRDIEYFVKAINIQLINKELVYKYAIITKNGLKQELIENEYIKG